jgi:recombinase
LNAEHIPNARGMPWSMLTVSNTLKNEAYIGNLVYNRRSQKLGERQVKNPPDMWIRRDNAFKPIVSPALFARAKKILVELEDGRTLSDKELLDKLKSLWRRKGHLSLKIMLAAKDVPNPTLYTRRFGSLTGAYKRIGFKPESSYNFTEHTVKIDSVVCSVAVDIIAAIEKRGRSATFLHELYLLTLSKNFTVSLTVAWYVANGKTEHGRWRLRKIRYTKSDLTLVIRLNTSNVDVQDYFCCRPQICPPDVNATELLSQTAYLLNFDTTT